jgi:hypothetical protein
MPVFLPSRLVQFVGPTADSILKITGRAGVLAGGREPGGWGGRRFHVDVAPLIGTVSLKGQGGFSETAHTENVMKAAVHGSRGGRSRFLQESWNRDGTEGRGESGRAWTRAHLERLCLRAANAQSGPATRFGFPHREWQERRLRTELVTATNRMTNLGPGRATWWQGTCNRGRSQSAQDVKVLRNLAKRG